jgi:recombination DNA repair RAD52 pathway protein
MTNENGKVIAPKNPLTIYQKMGDSKSDVLTTEQILYIFRKTPKQYIYTRPAKGGGTWDYVKGSYVEKVLNYVFGFDWDFEIKSKEEKYGQVIVSGRLTVRIGDRSIFKEQIGRADIKMRKGTTTPLDYGNDEKAAVTDCMKKCASKLGIASDVYAKDEYREIQMTEVKQEVGELPDGDKPATDEQIETLNKLLLPNNAYVKKEDYTKQQAADKIAELVGKK